MRTDSSFHQYRCHNRKGKILEWVRTDTRSSDHHKNCNRSFSTGHLHDPRSSSVILLVHSDKTTGMPLAVFPNREVQTLAKTATTVAIRSALFMAGDKVWRLWLAGLLPVDLTEIMCMQRAWHRDRHSCGGRSWGFWIEELSWSSK